MGLSSKVAALDKRTRRHKQPPPAGTGAESSPQGVTARLQFPCGIRPGLACLRFQPILPVRGAALRSLMPVTLMSASSHPGLNSRRELTWRVLAAGLKKGGNAACLRGYRPFRACWWESHSTFGRMPAGRSRDPSSVRAATRPTRFPCGPDSPFEVSRLQVTRSEVHGLSSIHFRFERPVVDPCIVHG